MKACPNRECIRCHALTTPTQRVEIESEVWCRGCFNKFKAHIRDFENMTATEIDRVHSSDDCLLQVPRMRN